MFLSSNVKNSSVETADALEGNDSSAFELFFRTMLLFEKKNNTNFTLHETFVFRKFLEL